MTSPAEPMAAAGQLLHGKYRLIRPLGSGGMGEVWLARNEGTDREFAIKLLLAKFAADADMLSRFMREAKVSGRVRHPGIVEVFDVARAPELGDAVFLVMEVLEGSSLHDLVSRQKRLPLGFLLDVGIALAHALGALHDKGIVHRDIKPSNIFLHRDPTGRIVPKLLDFGISKMETGPDEGELTRTGSIVGSPRYMSPEQAAGRKDVDARADVHGLGVTLWTCAAGYSPFDSSNYNNMIVSVITTDRQPLREVVPTVPEPVSLAIARAIHRSRELRHANGHELARALEEVRGTVQDGSSLEARQWVEDFIAAPPASAVSLRPGPSDASRSIGAVSVSFDEAGAAGMLQTELRAFQEAPTSELPAAASSVADPRASSARPPARRAGAKLALGVAGTVALVLLGARLFVSPSAPSPPATAASMPTFAPLPETTLPETTPPAAMAPALVAAATATTEPDEAQVTPDAGTLATAPRNVKRAAPLRTPPRPASASPAAAPATADPGDPHHGVTSSGL